MSKQKNIENDEYLAEMVAINLQTVSIQDCLITIYWALVGIALMIGFFIDFAVGICVVVVGLVLGVSMEMRNGQRRKIIDGMHFKLELAGHEYE